MIVRPYLQFNRKGSNKRVPENDEQEVPAVHRVQVRSRSSTLSPLAGRSRYRLDHLCARGLCGLLVLSMDELQRKTHLEAMALSLGVTMIFTVAYASFETANLLANARPSNILFVMGITYFGAVVVLWLKRTTE